MSAARMPRNREPVLPRWIELPSLARIVIGVALGLLALAAIGGAL